jgi:hypothetical protein
MCKWPRFYRSDRPAERPNRFQPVNITKVTSELAARSHELAGQEPKPSLRRIEQRLRQEGCDISYATVRRVPKRLANNRTARRNP